MALGKPFQGEIWFAPEVDYNQGWISGTSYLPSDKVIDARIDSGDIQIPLRGISSASICGWQTNLHDPILHVEWISQATSASLATYCCNRTSTGTLTSLTFVYGSNTDINNATDTWMNLTGCVCKTFTKTGTRGDTWKYSADFSVASVVSSSVASIGDKPAAVGGIFGVFNDAGSITWAGVTASAFITDSFEITVENNLNDCYTVGSKTKINAIPGAIDITGSCDISLDDGGGAHWDEVILNKDITSIIIDTGTGSGVNDVWTLANGKFTSTSIDNNIDSNVMMTSQPFVFKSLTIA